MMPAKSEKQKRFMDAAAHNPSFAKAAGIPVSVAKEFSEASKGKTFGSGGSKSRADVQAINKPKTNHGESGFFSKGGAMKQVDMKKNPGMAKLPTAVRNKMGFMKKGGMASDAKEDMKMDLKQDKSMMQKAVNKHEGRLHKGQPMTKLAKGGFTKEANGIAVKGKTKGTMVKMNKGGMSC
jgi:hypothetical protein